MDLTKVVSWKRSNILKKCLIQITLGEKPTFVLSEKLEKEEKWEKGGQDDTWFTGKENM